MSWVICPKISMDTMKKEQTIYVMKALFLDELFC